MDGPGLSLVIPAFNESAVIATAVAEALAALTGRFRPWEILVVDDGSSDGTADLVPDVPGVRLIRHTTNRGYGAALRTGFEAARYDCVAFTDADCQFDLSDLEQLAPLTERAAVAVGYRVDRKDPWRRRFLSWGYNRLARTLLCTGVRDVDCALKVFRRDALAELLPESRGFFINTEMLARANRLGFPVVERPVTHRPRLGGESKVSLKEVPRTFAVLIRFWWKNVLWAKPITRRRVLTATVRIDERRPRFGVPGRVGDPVPRPESV